MYVKVWQEERVIRVEWVITGTGRILTRENYPPEYSEIRVRNLSASNNLTSVVFRPRRVKIGSLLFLIVP